MVGQHEETDVDAIVRMIGERTGGDYSPEAVCKLLDEMLGEDRRECERMGIKVESENDVR